MNSKEETTTLDARLAKAIYGRDGWKAAGIQEKYLEAYSLVDALELLLDQQNRQIRESKIEDARVLPESHGLLGEPQLPIRQELPGGVSKRAQVTSELSIGFNGRHYHYHGYRYDLLSDAVNYATLQRSRARNGDAALVEFAAGERNPIPEAAMPPNASDLRLMSSLAITFRNGIYLFGPYRYDNLADAVRYAQLMSREDLAIERVESSALA